MIYGQRISPSCDLPQQITLRRPQIEDHLSVVGVIPGWWGLPETSPLPMLLPRLFFQHFADTSMIAESPRGLSGFLIGFRSSAQSDTAYIHFVGVRPDLRQLGLARALYETFFDDARAAGCTHVEAITGPGNHRSRAFHIAMGFEASGDTDFDGVRAWRDYDGHGEHRVAFTRRI